MIKRAKERHERQLAGRDESRRKSKEQLPQQPCALTRSKTAPFNRDVCFFCDGKETYKEPLHQVSTFSAGDSLDTAIRKSQNEKLLVKLSTAVDIARMPMLSTLNIIRNAGQNM